MRVLINDETGVINGEARKGSARLDLACWQLAWDSHALALIALDHMTWAQTQAHKAAVVEVALTAHVEERCPMLGILFDEVCRYAL